MWLVHCVSSAGFRSIFENANSFLLRPLSADMIERVIDYQKAVVK